MNVLKMSGKALVTLILIGGLNSCLIDKNEEDFKVYTDVFTIKKKIGDQVNYAMSFFAYGNKVMSSAKVTPPVGAGEMFELSYSSQSVFTMSKEPSLNDFRPYTPTNGEYAFEVVSADGEVIQSSDYLNFTNMDIPDILSAEFNSSGASVNLVWRPVSKAKGYALKILDASGKLIYFSNTLAPETNTYPINISSGEWIEATSAGEKYYIQVQAFSYDSDATDEDYMYNLGEISIGEREVIWGQ